MWKDCRELQDTITEFRRDLHRIPETGGHLPATRAYVEKKLREYGIPFTENRSDDGIIAEKTEELRNRERDLNNWLMEMGW